MERLLYASKVYVSSIAISGDRCIAFMLMHSKASNEPCEINNLCINFPPYLTISVGGQNIIQQINYS